MMGDGPVKLAVAEMQSDLRLRATATVAGDYYSLVLYGNLMQKFSDTPRIEDRKSVV